MRACLLFPVLVVFASAVYADDEKPLKPISELEFCRRLGEFNRKVKYSGTKVQREEQVKEYAADYLEKFRTSPVVIDAVLSGVEWHNGKARLMYVSKLADNVRRKAGLAAVGRISCECERERLLGLNLGDKVRITASLRFEAAELPPRNSLHVFYYHGHPTDGQFVSEQWDVVVGKEAFVFEQKVSK